MSNRISISVAAWGLVFFVICSYVASQNLTELDLRIAIGGWSPIDWVNHLRFPQNFTHDFPSGIENYGKSLFLYIYPVSLAFFGIEPERLIMWVVPFEVLFLGLGVVCLARALQAGAPPLALLLLLLFVISSYARDSELACWAHPFVGLYYNTADGLRPARSTRAVSLGTRCPTPTAPPSTTPAWWSPA